MTYPMFATTTMTFGALMVLRPASSGTRRISKNSVVHRGVTLYEPS